MGNCIVPVMNETFCDGMTRESGQVSMQLLLVVDLDRFDFFWLKKKDDSF